MERAAHLIEALPYIRRFYGKTIVIKCGGAATSGAQDIENIAQDIALLYFCGLRPVVVHGGGPEISDLCRRLNITPRFSGGQRVTDAATLEAVQMSLLGKSNKAWVTMLNQHGVKAVGLSGQDAAFLRAEKREDPDDLGYVGKITHVDTALLHTLLASSYLPVVAPIGVGTDGQAYNINADFASGAIAGGLSAEKLILLSDVNGIYADARDPATRLSQLRKEAADVLISDGKISGGMIPKLQACLQALEHGVPSAHILNGKSPHSLLLEILTDRGVGTMVIP